MPTEDSSEEELLKFLGKSLPPSPEPQTPAPQQDIPEDTGSDEEVTKVLSGEGSEDYKVVGFEDPVEMLWAVNKNLQTGATKLWDWQVETLVFLAADVHDFESRLRFCLTAANGSGKDAYILAPFAVWQLTEKIRSRFIGTSKSAHQLNTQTNPYIRHLVTQYTNFLVREGFHPKPFICRNKPFHIVCTFTGGEILNFVTDEAENIEGYHPFPDTPKAPLTIAINEAKGVPDEYFDGFARCTYSRWIEITSPGRTSGRNYEHYNSSVQYPEKLVSSKFYSRRITSYDCPHKSPKSIEEDAEQFGRESDLFKSKHLALYTSIGESIVLSADVVDKYLNEPPIYDGRKDVAGGLDLSLGGDETTLCKRTGNRTDSFDGTRIRNAVLLVSYLDKLFANRGFTKKDPIYTDVGGLGKPIFDMLCEKGWNLIPILNNATAIGFDKNLYGNRGTEIYFEVCAHYSKGTIIPLKHKLWREQISCRKYIRPDNEKLRMQPKAQLKKDKDKKALANSADWESPDYADAWVLAYANFEPSDVVIAREQKKKEKGKLLVRVKQKDLVEAYAEIKFGGYKAPEGLQFKPSGLRQRSIIQGQIEEYNKSIKGS